MIVISTLVYLFCPKNNILAVFVIGLGRLFNLKINNIDKSDLLILNNYMIYYVFYNNN